MPRAALVLLVSLALLPGCARLAESRLNPLNWFGNSRPVAITPEEAAARPLVPAGRGAAVQDLRVPVAAVTFMAVEPTSSGAILRATGTLPTQGWFNAELVPVPAEDGVLAYEFRAEAPSGFAGEGAPATRTITVARVLDAADLAGVRVVRVIGAGNARESRR